ncbi:MAG TPA: GGDEF domain-containing protein [Gemmatimonadales bacterium]|nr:GGDEF domain-containing protein [Gemmatimonadales bacterium]
MTTWQDTIARRLRAVHLDTIRNQMLVFAVVATLVPALAVTIVSHRQNRPPSIGDQVAAELRGASADAAWDIDQWLSDRLRDLRVAATAYAVAENLARTQGSAEAVGRLRDYLNSVRERCPDCEGLLVLDARGRFVTSSGGRMSGVQFSQDRLTTLRTSDALVGDAYWDAGLGKATLALAVPIRQADGRYVGALMAKLNLRSVADILQRIAPTDSGDVYLMNEQGRLILRLRSSSAEVMRTKVPPATAQALIDREGTTVEYKRADGRAVIGTLRRIPALRWAAVVEMPRAEVVRRAGGSGSGLGVTLVLLLAGAGLVTYVGVLLVRPLERLAGAAAKVAAGDLSVELPSAGRGEVGLLTQVFKNLLMRLREREGQGELERLSVTDALTGLYNRRHLMGTLANEVQRSRRLRRTFSVLLADVDHFKQYNDTHGHLGGDAALVKVAEILRKMTRGVDSVARYGGEEFVVMLIEAPIATAAAVGERIRARVAAEEFSGGKMTVSVGAAEYPTHGDTPEELIASADAAMYEAKGGGRDRVVVAGRRADLEKEGKRRRKGEA